MKRTLLPLVLGLALLSPAAARAANWNWLTQYQTPNIHYGQLALHPYYDFSQVYDSNIYLVPRDQPGGKILGGGHRESWITRNTLGLEALLPWRRLHELAFGYDFESQIYTTQPDINNAIDQSAHVDYTYKGAYGLTYKAGDKYLNTTDPAFSQLTGRQWRWQNNAHTSLDYKPANGRLAGGLDASQTNDKYIRPDLAAQLNRFEDNFGFNAGYMVRPKTKVYLAYHRDIIHYSVPAQSIDKDNRSHNFGLGVDGQLAPKWEGQVEAGASYRQYDVASSSGQSRVFLSATVAASVLYKADPYTTVKISVHRFAEESIDASNPLYFDNVATVDVTHRFPRKFSAGLTGTFEVDQYPFSQVIDSGGTVVKRRDDTYMYGGWVTYDIQKWLSTGFAFNRRERNSTIPSLFNFDENLVAWHATLRF